MAPSTQRNLLGLPLEWGAAGLTTSAGIAGWIEMLLLRARLNARIGSTGIPVEYVGKLWASAATAAAVAWILKLTLPQFHPVVAATLVLGAYGLAFFGSVLALRVPEASTALSRLARIGSRR